MKYFTLLVFILISCNSGSSPNGVPIQSVVSDNELHAYGQCRHEALVAAAMYEEAGYETRIPYGKINGSDEYHVQAQVLIDGKWHWLTTRTIVATIDYQDDFEVSKIYTVDEIYENIVGGVWY